MLLLNRSPMPLGAARRLECRGDLRGRTPAGTRQPFRGSMWGVERRGPGQRYPGGRLTAQLAELVEEGRGAYVSGTCGSVTPDPGEGWLEGVTAGNTGSHRASEKETHHHHPGAWSGAWHIVGAQ